VNLFSDIRLLVCEELRSIEMDLPRQFIWEQIVVQQRRQVEQFHVVVDDVVSWNVLEDVTVVLRRQHGQRRHSCLGGGG